MAFVAERVREQLDNGNVSRNQPGLSLVGPGFVMSYRPSDQDNVGGKSEEFRQKHHAAKGLPYRRPTVSKRFGAHYALSGSHPTTICNRDHHHRSF